MAVLRERRRSSGTGKAEARIPKFGCTLGRLEASTSMVKDIATQAMCNIVAPLRTAMFKKVKEGHSKDGAYEAIEQKTKRP